MSIRKGLLILCLLLTFAQMGSIFYMSSKDSDESTVFSSAISMIIRQFTLRDFNDLEKEEKESLVSEIDPSIREIAHLMEYLILGFLITADAFLITGLCGKRGIRIRLIAFLVAVLYALSDEIHQIFVPGRAFEWTDLLVDSLGALIGCALGYKCILSADRLHIKRISKGDRKC
ncbi:MAG: VanZ family protein [Lachnospiraceae bacterium]|nr:VanZ family protein [Lachnospiraceae bacterium]